jgi:hypothetical protein
MDDAADRVVFMLPPTAGNTFVRAKGGIADVGRLAHPRIQRCGAQRTGSIIFSYYEKIRLYYLSVKTDAAWCYNAVYSPTREPHFRMMKRKNDN